MDRRIKTLVKTLLALAVLICSTTAPAQEWDRRQRLTYIVGMSAQATTAGMALSIESSAATGFKLAGWCITTSNATAAAALAITIQRRTTASSGGIACTNEFTTIGGTGCHISKMDMAAANFGGVGRNGGTAGTAGAVIDQMSYQTGIVATGAGGLHPICRDYTQLGQLPAVRFGTANGLTIVVGAAGAGGLASGSINAIIFAEN